MKRQLLLISIAVASCSTVPATTPDAAGMCTASDVSYSNATSRLVATSVQAGLDELAAKSEPRIAPRLEYVQRELMNAIDSTFIGGAPCPDEVHDLPISGRCVGPVGTVLRGFAAGITPTDAEWNCTWSKTTPDWLTEPYIVGVYCLRNAR